MSYGYIEMCLTARWLQSRRELYSMTALRGLIIGDGATGMDDRLHWHLLLCWHRMEMMI